MNSVRFVGLRGRPAGSFLYWQLTALGVDCQVIAPSLVPTKAGHRPWVGGFLKKRQAGLSQEVIDIGWKAQQRLCKRYQKLSHAGKNKPQVVTAVGREMLGFIWAIAVHIERKQRTNRAA